MYRLLVVDDEYYVRKRVVTCIDWKKWGIDEVIEASDADEALRWIGDKRVHIAVLDISMPGMTGLELMRTIRDTDRRMKIIILTGYSDFKYAQQAIDMGVAAFLLKPLEENKMEEAVGKVTEELREEALMEALLQENGSLQKMVISGRSGKGDGEEGVWLREEKEEGGKSALEKGEDKRVSGEQIVKKAKDIVRRDYWQEELGLKEIADKMCLNSNYLSSTFKRYAGIGLIEYLNRVRLEEAKKKLEQSMDSIWQIAEDVGYTDQFYFSKKFKKMYGMSPLSYRYDFQVK